MLSFSDCVPNIWKTGRDLERTCRRSRPRGSDTGVPLISAVGKWWWILAFLQL